MQQTAAQVPWFHNCLLLDRVSKPATRLPTIDQIEAQLSGELGEDD